jgi:hypothetical protein
MVLFQALLFIHSHSKHGGSTTCGYGQAVRRECASVPAALPTAVPPGPAAGLPSPAVHPFTRRRPHAAAAQAPAAGPGPAPPQAMLRSSTLAFAHLAAASASTCDIFAAGNTPCVAAHSTVRALFKAYSGPLYQVTRADGKSMDIKAMPGGYADAASQDKFCAGATCVFSQIYDQSPKGNHLGIAPAGGAHRQQDKPANAAAGPTTIGGHKVYGLRMDPPSGYRRDNTTDIATGDEAETMYAVFNGSHYNNRCCL